MKVVLWSRPNHKTGTLVLQLYIRKVAVALRCGENGSSKAIAKLPSDRICVSVGCHKDLIRVSRHRNRRDWGTSEFARRVGAFGGSTLTGITTLFCCRPSLELVGAVAPPFRFTSVEAKMGGPQRSPGF
ncbi:hypothetical protein CIHG_06959 [Coccidioides immitis H538.4]|uniref:Uncharacterized protein n=3 Tax=Coccidioides immitis TaxID=5501 RepID=A0A0J8R186_COCIT|nr:hypothetical protein CIRG_10004 [Coccidioides immitis RMSCC 2394]KMU78506.1 hypothetical protein CISG_07167 [Coccidioides immitis RMSCC 3703]KMU89288.1 hypothetical protein CIHG_06959 [Coccidioides immitis H538.4]